MEGERESQFRTNVSVMNSIRQRLREEEEEEEAKCLVIWFGIGGVEGRSFKGSCKQISGRESIEKFFSICKLDIHILRLVTV